MQKRVVTFGEVMMRLSPEGQARFRQATNFNVVYAGSEANVAASLSFLGVPAAHVTCFPDNDLGKAAAHQLQSYGVDMQFTRYRDGRIGVYFIEHGASVRSPKIIYDRFDSAFAHLDPREFDWDKILANARWFHWTGITPAISQAAADACLEAIKTARKIGIRISGDINYRRNLWQYGKHARDIMPALIEMTDTIIAGVTDFDNCLGIAEDTFDKTCRKVMQSYPSIKVVASSTRETISASHNKLGAILFNGKELITSAPYDILPIVDRVGAGDAFMAGLIYGFIQGKTEQQTLDFALAACALKHTVEGDVNVVDAAEIESLVRGENVGKLLR
jgi:2-dehydro-3-deoxygluconokinase